MRNLKVILTLGGIAHAAILSALDKKKSDYKFSHNGEFKLNKNLQLVSSYHCSRYNTKTGRLTQEMFEAIFEGIKRKLQTHGFNLFPEEASIFHVASHVFSDLAVYQLAAYPLQLLLQVLQFL